MIAPAPAGRIHIRLRGHQLAAWDQLRRFTVLVWHRRAGKTFFAVARLLARALGSKRKDYRGYYIAPTYGQAKRLSWDYLKRFVQSVPGVAINEAELRVDFPNGARIQLLGGEQYDSLRGQYADDLVIDEAAMIAAPAWRLVLLPMLADRLGNALIIGTPMGRVNLFYELWEKAGNEINAGSPDWARSLLKWSDTRAIEPAEIARLQSALSQQEFAQEFECSWSGSIPGAVYANEMDQADAAGRVCQVARDSTYPVIAALDLGWNDTMSVVWFQEIVGSIRVLESRGYERTAIPDLVGDWRGAGLVPAELILPHDARVTELGTGQTREEVFRTLLPGIAVTICPNLGREEGIEQVRQILERTWFDRAATVQLREALGFYHRGYDEVGRVRKLTPVHDWSSHWADAFRYAIVGRPGSGQNGAGTGKVGSVWGPRGKMRLGV